jgi:tRNA(Ile)-lysidine synthase
MLKIPMELLKNFNEFINQQNLFSQKDKLLLAVSGGVDSVVLCELCHQAGFNFALAHCNFQLRGDDSDRDEKFVNELAIKYNTPFYSTSFDAKKEAQQRKLSIQETARELRYKWFEETRTAKGYNYILTAHHADDNIETVLMNFFRGTGIRGIGGIEPKQNHIIRPLLFARRIELEEFLEENELEFVSDFTNLREDYTRNYFRIKVIPFLEKIYPEVNENILDNIGRFREVELLYKQAIEQHKKKLLEPEGNEIHIPALKLKKSEPVHTIIYEIIKDYGFASRQVKEVIDLLDSESGKYICSSTHRIIKNRKWIIIAPLQADQADHILIEEGEKNVQCSMFNVQFSIIPILNSKPGRKEFLEQNSNLTALLDAAEISYPLMLRKWKQGDYFYPLGMKKKKKLSRFFIDQKLSKTEKEKTWVIEMDRKIIWVVGHRIDDRFKVTDKTKTVLQITSR